MADPHEGRERPVLLLIDDDLVSREVTATVLTMGGYLVHAAEDGNAALRMLDAGACTPDAVLMDTQMPGISGVELIAALRTRGKMRILAISGSSAADDVAAAADGFLLKPFDTEAVDRALQAAWQSTGSTARQASVAAEYPVLSLTILAQLRQMMPERGVRQIFAALVEDMEKRISALDAAIAQADLPEIRRIGHAIKGGCSMGGAMQASLIGSLLETLPDAAESNQLDNSRQLLAELRTALTALQRMLEAELPA